MFWGKDCMDKIDTAIPHIGRILVPEKICVTQKLHQGDCAYDSTNAEFPQHRQTLRKWKPR